MPQATAREAVTALLTGDREGRTSVDDLVPVVYHQLHELAHRQLRRELGPRTLDTTGLVHETYLKLVDSTRVPVESRAYFFAAAARAMRQVLIDAARRRGSQKRGGGQPVVPLTDDLLAVDEFAVELLDLDQALVRLARVYPRQARVVECRFFGGLSVEETACALELSERTVKRDWALARAWLYRELGRGT